MTRLENFLRAAASGYAVLASNIVYTLLSLRMAVTALPREEYGVWAAAVQIGAVLTLMDFGLSTAVSRYLIDHKDDRNGGGYGRMLKATFIVQCVQAALVVVIGLGLVSVSVSLLGIPEQYRDVFNILLLGQVGLIALGFPVKFVGNLLIVHQRHDLLNFAQVLQMAIQLPALWLAFKVGAGVYGLLWAALAGFAVSVAFVCVIGLRREFLPSRNCWGRISWPEFRGVFKFSQGVFFVSVGMQLLTASQIVVVTKMMGLAAAADWNIYTRSSILVCALVWRSFDVAFPAFSEMIARGESELFLKRVNELLRAVMALTVVGAVGIAAANQPFVQVWLGLKDGWTLSNDWLLGSSIVPLTLSRCLITVLLSLKDVAKVPSVLVAEGVTFVLLGGVLAGTLGFAGILAASIISSALFTTRYAVVEVCRRLNIGVNSALARWLGGPVLIFGLLAVLASALILLTWSNSGWRSLGMRGGIVAVTGFFLVWKFGLDASLRAQVGRIARRYLPGGISHINR